MLIEKNVLDMKTKKRMIHHHFFAALTLAVVFTHCKRDSNGGNTPPPPPVNPPVTNEMDFWLTKSDETVKLQKQNGVLAFGTTANQYQNIEVDENSSFQSIDGFGYTLTG